MTARRRAPYGSWPSPWTAERVAGAQVRLAEVRLDGDRIHWLERRPAEGGRSVVVRREPGGAAADATPAGADARNTVHEYGGGSFAVAGGVVYYTELGDGRVWAAGAGGEARPVSAPGPWRFADLVLDPVSPRLYAVQEDHSGPGEPVNRVVALDLGPEPVTPRVVVEGADFYAAPTPSPDGRRLAWVSWRHPDMPWDATELHLGELDPAGRLAAVTRVAGGGDLRDAVREPRFAPSGALCFASDRTGWWNLYRREHDGAVAALTTLEAEVGGPHWVFGESFYALVGDHDLIFAANQGGRFGLHRQTGGGPPVALDQRFTEVRYLHTDGRRAVFVGASPAEAPAVVALDLATGSVTVVRSAGAEPPPRGWLSSPRAFDYVTAGGARAHGFFYPPENAELEGPEGERPPLVVMCHGGPTAAASTALAPGIQFWTSRGFAVADLNYRGSTGFGRAYRESLYGQWGVAEVDDCVAAVRHLAAAGEIDPRRVVIRGGSAGGFTALAALVFRDAFAAGASYYGIGDLETLARDTHKFESRYCDRLVGPYPERRDLYRERSPLHAAGRLSCPVIFFQGLEDRVVPPNQAEAMVAVLREKGLPVAYVPFPGEQHGFRRAETVRRALECELFFYSRVLGFELPDPAPDLLIENLGTAGS